MKLGHCAPLGLYREEEECGDYRGGGSFSGGGMADSPHQLTSQQQTSDWPSSSSASATGEMASSPGKQSEKRKRGRPRKPKPEQPAVPKEKRPRGRPKGSKNKTPSRASVMKSFSSPSRRGSRSRGEPGPASSSPEVEGNGGRSATTDQPSQ